MHRGSGRIENENIEEKVTPFIQRLLNNNSLKVINVYSDDKFPVVFRPDRPDPSLQTLRSYESILKEHGVSARVIESHDLIPGVYKVPDQLVITDSLEEVLRKMNPATNHRSDDRYLQSRQPVINSGST